MNTYNAQAELIAHRIKYGSNYLMPSGKMIRLTDKELVSYLKENGYTIAKPSEQGDCDEAVQVGIKHG